MKEKSDLNKMYQDVPPCTMARKKHRYIPTTYERTVLGYRFDTYDYCLECGKKRGYKDESRS